MMGGLRFLLLSVTGLLYISTVKCSSDDLDVAFRHFLSEHGYTGGSFAALKVGRLVMAKGYGVTREGTEVKVGSRYPISSLSKSLTAVATLKLVQQGKLNLDDTVFGKTGVLHTIEPIDEANVDPRIYDITVEHLLRHSTGWDQSVAPLFDPVMNEVFQTRGHTVPSIARVLNVPTPLNAHSIIKYAISQPMHFTPGSKVMYNNLGYLILGRVIKEASGVAYGDFVKKNVLNPCGMWHTHLGDLSASKQSHKLDRDVALKDTPLTERAQRTPQVMDILNPLTVDASLGWYSNVFDLVRFSRCVFDGNELLNDTTTETLLKRQASAEGALQDSWLCAGFRSNTRGEVWQDGDPRADDVLLFRDVLSKRIRKGKHVSVATDVPDTFVLLLHGNKLHHLKHHAKDLMKHLTQEVTALQNRPHLLSGNLFGHDLSDIDASSVQDDVFVKFHVDEHHLDAYVSAVKKEGYDVRWVSPYDNRPRGTSHASFLLISRRVAGSAESELDWILQHGLGENDLLSRKLHMERQGYNLTFLQSYRSDSHQDSPHTFLAVFRKHAYDTDTQMKYGTQHLPEPYDKLVQMYQEKSFYPLAQTVLPHTLKEKEERLSFIFVQTPRSPVDFRNVYRIGEVKLERAVMQNADKGRTLTFLHPYRLQNRARFAAVFTNQTHPRWDFHGGLSKDKARELMESRLTTGLRPAIAAASLDDGEKEVKFTVYLRSDQDVAQHDGGGRFLEGAESPHDRKDGNVYELLTKDDDYEGAVDVPE